MALYSDPSVLFPKKGDLRNQNLNLAAVFGSLENIFSTNRDERLFNLDVTADLDSLLFQPLHEDLADELYDKVRDALGRLEPRVTVLGSKSRVVPDYENNRYDVQLVLRIRGFEQDNIFRAFLSPNV